VYKGAWCSYLRKCSDPDANALVTKEHLKHFEMREDVHKIPAELWSRWVKLCFHFVDKVSSQLEVSIRFLRNAENPAEYRAIVPKQSVTMASVRADNFDNCVDIETGEEFTSYPPTGWIPVGSSHSHNTMNAFFSGVDDKYELDDPGIHLTVGKVDIKNNRYEIAASVVGSRRRFIVHYNELIDATPVDGATFHENVLKYVDTTPRATPAFRATRTATANILKRLPPAQQYHNKTEKKTYGSIQEYYRDVYGEIYGSETWDNESGGWQNFQTEKYNDPFYWNDGQVEDEIQKDVPVVSEDIYPIIDLLNDYLKENRNDSDALDEMKQALSEFLIGVELELSS
jgi:hypothetical protein